MLSSGLALAALAAWLLWPRAHEPAELAASPTTEAAAGGLEAARTDSGGERGAHARSVVSPDPGGVDERATGAADARLTVLCVARGSGRPLEGVEVRAAATGYRNESPTSRSRGVLGEALSTDAAGRVEFTVQPGLEVLLLAGDLAHDVSEVEARVAPLLAGETREQRLEHDAGTDARFHAIVLERDGERPVAGARVSARGQLVTTSAATGRFELDIARWNPRLLEIEADGYGPLRLETTAEYDTPARARRILLERAASLTITLLLPASEASSRVELTARGHELSTDSDWQATTNVTAADASWSADADALGVCVFPSLPPGVPLVGRVVGATRALLRGTAPITLAAGEERRVEWDLRAGCTLRGRVLESDGGGAADVSLWMLKDERGLLRYVESYRSKDIIARTRSAADGSFRFDAVSVGTWLLAPDPEARPTAAEQAYSTCPLAVTVADGQGEAYFELHLQRGLYIRGRLLAPDGESGVQGTLRAKSLAGEQVLAYAQVDGSFAIGPLSPGRFELRGSGHGNFLDSESARVDAGADGVELRLRDGARLAGKVVDSVSGSGVQAAILVAPQGDGVNRSWTISRTDEAGNFSFDGLEPGRYALTATTTGGLAGERRGVAIGIGSPAEGLVVPLTQGARVRVRFAGLSGTADFTISKDGAVLAGDEVQAGTSSSQVLPAGKLEAHFVLPGTAQSERLEFTVSPGEERELVFGEGD